MLHISNRICPDRSKALGLHESQSNINTHVSSSHQLCVSVSSKSLEPQRFVSSIVPKEIAVARVMRQPVCWCARKFPFSRCFKIVGLSQRPLVRYLNFRLILFHNNPRAESCTAEEVNEKPAAVGSHFSALCIRSLAAPGNPELGCNW